MTTGTFNKIVQGNFNLRPWILSKNTNEIVNTYIEKIYKQIPNNFKKDLLKGRTVTPRPENKAPIRYYRSQEHSEVPVIRPQILKSRSTGERLSTNFVFNKKLLKSANYKIYGSRRFGSSASSSNASIFRRFDERRRNRNSVTQQLSRRTISLHSPKTSIAGNVNLGNYTMPIRNQHMQGYLGSVPKAIEVSNNIQQDLMLIDSVLKDRISVIKSKLVKLLPEASTSNANSNSNSNVNPLSGWDHPPSPDVLLTRWNERNRASIELQEQHRKLKLSQKNPKSVNSYNANLSSSAGASSKSKRRLRLDDCFKVTPSHSQNSQTLNRLTPSSHSKIQSKTSQRESVLELLDQSKPKIIKSAERLPIEVAINRKEKLTTENGSLVTSAQAQPVADTATSVLVAEALANGIVRSRYNHSMFYKSDRY